MSKKILLIIEGDSEVSFLKSLGITGKCKQSNLYQSKISKTLRNINQDIIYIFYDTDLLENKKKKDLFLNNLKKIKDQKKLKFYLLSQEKNLEDTIINACNLSQKELLVKLGLKNKGELKDKIIANSPHLISRLTSPPINLDLDKLWVPKNLDRSMEIYKDKHCTYKDLQKNPKK